MPHNVSIRKKFFDEFQVDPGNGFVVAVACFVVRSLPIEKSNSSGSKARREVRRKNLGIQGDEVEFLLREYKMRTASHSSPNQWKA